jgi:transcriptional regulator with XRE-family HTH domain
MCEPSGTSHLPGHVINRCWRGALLTAAQMKAARALVGMEQKALAEASGVSLPTIQRMEASNGTVRGVIESLTRVMAALEAAGVEFINEGAASSGGGRGVRLRRRHE